jgi:hypothetical protein
MNGSGVRRARLLQGLAQMGWLSGLRLLVVKGEPTILRLILPGEPLQCRLMDALERAQTR